MKQINWLDSLGFTRDWVFSIPKSINENECWIPLIGTLTDKGYILLQVNGFRFTLSRITVCIFNNLDYFNSDIECRHGARCIRACFNPEHLLYGSHGDNIRDTVAHKTHHNSAKDICPKCGGRYHFVLASRNNISGRRTRRCRTCYNENKRRWRAKKE